MLLPMNRQITSSIAVRFTPEKAKKTNKHFTRGLKKLKRTYRPTYSWLTSSTATHFWIGPESNSNGGGGIWKSVPE